MSQNDNIWMFGFGSNMDIDALQIKKKVKVLEYTAATCKGWRMAFNIGGLDYVEPSFANAQEGDSNDEIHGMAFMVSQTDALQIDIQEGNGKHYNRVACKLETYDNRKIDAFLYVAINPKSKEDEKPPSKRYLNILIKGAKQIGLMPEYIQELVNTVTYIPSQETLDIRNKFPELENLTGFTIKQLQDQDEQYVYSSLLGYVMKYKKENVFFKSHIGRDITARQLRHFRGQAMDGEGDDMGLPPFTNIYKLTDDELEYLRQWLDRSVIVTGNGFECIVGHLIEFVQQMKNDKQECEQTMN